jgi:iron complex outermembrane receptor protein
MSTPRCCADEVYRNDGVPAHPGSIPDLVGNRSLVKQPSFADTNAPDTELKRLKAMTRVFTSAGMLACCASIFCPGARLYAQGTAVASGVQQLPTAVVEATAIAGSAMDADKVPGNVQTLSAADLSRTGSASLTGAMDDRLGSINLNDNLDDPFQPDILYRGFEASPVLGTPQGLAVYQNGVRINEAFGDTVNWDLFPDIAINRVTLVSSSPVYGLNALGGGISISMKDGFSYQGADAEVSGGSFGNHAAAVQFGANAGGWGLYLAGNAVQSTGWREFSEDSLRQLYAVLSAHNELGSLDLSFTRSDNQLDGKGAVPVQELGVSRALIFTSPQSNINRLNFLTLNGTLKATDTWSLQSVLYYRQYQQLVQNGNTTNYTACTGEDEAGLLCQPDQVTPLTGPAGQTLPDVSPGGAVPIGENDSEAISAFGRGAALQSTDSAQLFGLRNAFTVGAALDYARLDFSSGAAVGLISPQLLVLPSSLIVDTTESEQNAAIAAGNTAISATPVGLAGINRNVGAYVTETLDLTPAFSLTASGRYNTATIDLKDQLGTNLTGINRYTHFNPAVGGTYRLLPTVTVYAGIAQNARTPTASEIECSNPVQPCLLPSNLAGDPPTLRQVIAHTLEFGLRGRISAASAGRDVFTWNVGAFRTNLDDDIYGIATSLSTGFFQNIGATRRQGLEAGVNYQGTAWSSYLNYSYVDACFESPLLLPSPSNPLQDANGNIQVEPGDRLPGIPQHRIKAGADVAVLSNWSVGATVRFVSNQYYFGDASNQNAPLPSYTVLGFRTSFKPVHWLEVYGHIDNLLDAHYATYGTLSDPTGVGAPGVPVAGVTNGPGVDNRFQSPAAPFAVFGGFRASFH